VLDSPSITAFGGYIEHNKTIVGPFNFTGMNLSYVLDILIDTSEDFTLTAVASDGKHLVLTRAQVYGEVKIYDPSTGAPLGYGTEKKVNLLLAYHKDGQNLTVNGSFMIAYVGPDSPITNSHHWIKNVTKISISRLKGSHLEIRAISDFKTTDSNILIDSFMASLHNTVTDKVLIGITSGCALEFSDGTPIRGWNINLDLNEITIPGLSIQSIPLTCDPIIGLELTPGNATIFIKLTYLPMTGTSIGSARMYMSDLLTVGDTIGPVFIESEQVEYILTNLGLNLSLGVTNNGSTDLNLSLEFSTNDDSLYFVINGVNDTNHIFLLPKFSYTLFPSDIFTVKPKPSQVSQNREYFILIFLKRQETMEVLAFLLILITYQSY
jgi:hypothetical protein